MFEVFKFECRYQWRSPLFIILAVSFFLLAFLIMGSESVNLGGVGNNLNLNAAWVIVYTHFFFSIIGMFAAIVLVSSAITRDYEQKTAEILFATGITSKQFLLGRFFAGTLFGILVGLAALAGTLVATLMPWLDQERVAAFQIAPFAYAAFVVIIPNLFFSSALFYSIAALTRSLLAAFVGAVGFLVLYIIVGNIADPERIDLYAMFDPFGGTAFEEVSRYWTVVERNHNLVPVSGALLINRFVSVGLGLLALLLTAWRYNFSLNPSPFRRRSNANKKVSAKDIPPGLVEVEVSPRFDSATYVKQFLSQVRIDMASIFRSVPFYAILGFALLNVLGGFSGVTTFYGADLLPTTGSILLGLQGSYLFLVLLIIIYYAGEVVYRERTTLTAHVIDAAPFPNGVMVMAKIVSLWGIITALLLIGVLAGMGFQLSEGYFNFELGLYAQGLFFVSGGFFYLLAVLAVFIQVLAGNKWVGMVGLMLTFFIFQALPSIGFEHGLYSFGTPNAPHSDMNQYGHFWQPLVAFTIYWMLFCILLGLIAHLFFIRGELSGFRDRLSMAKSRISGVVAVTAVTAVCGFVGFGGWIFYNTNVLNDYELSDSLEERRAAYEKSYKSFELMDQAEPIAVDAQVDLYPNERRLESRGSAILKNTSAKPIDEIFLSTHPLIEVNSLLVSGGSVLERNDEYGVHRYKLATPLGVEETLEMSWHLTWAHVGFANGNETAVTAGASNRVVANGTFVNNSEIMPGIGYNAGAELSDPNKRREHDLPPIVRLPKLGDPAWINRSQFGFSERTDFKVVFSTSADQIAVAPGYLVGDVVERDGRRIYTYAMDAPIWPFFSFVSARYEVARDVWHDGKGDEVAIEIYHDPAHTYNVEPMIRGTKKSLDYFTREFSPYQYRQFRILEFPRYATFAQSFPNTIPFSEAIGFVIDLRDEDAIDVAFYVTAHELAHQWWAHQVVGANMQGMTVIVETLAQYSALMVMEQEYGKDKMRRFLRYELDRYLSQRGSEQIAELPLMYSENQQYIHYQKGSLVMYALQDAIGVDKVNLALRNFIDKYAFTSKPFPTAEDLVVEFKQVAGSEHLAFIEDLFEKITLYDLSIGDAKVTQVDGGYEVSFTTQAKKFYAQGDGREVASDLDLYIDLAIFPDTEEDLDDYQLPNPLYFERHKISQEETKFTLVVDELPKRVGIDPYNKLIDRNPEDNLQYVAL